MSALATDLNLPVTKCAAFPFLLVLGLHKLTLFFCFFALIQKRVQDFFKSLGCTIVYPTKEEKERASADGMSAKEIRELKKAAIKLPLTFPKPKRGRKQA